MALGAVCGAEAHAAAFAVMPMTSLSLQSPRGDSEGEVFKLALDRDGHAVQHLVQDSLGVAAAQAAL
jgi:hypothetical protein